MPIYEYECTNCHQQFDLLQKVSDEPVKRCSACFQDTAVRLVSAAGFQLKGSGWYATDFKNKNTTPATSGDSGSAKGKDGEKKVTETTSTTDKGGKS